MQLVWLVKEVALTLNAHFPGRLAALWVVDAPAVIKWPLKALRKLLHPATGQKVQTCSADDPALPKSLYPALKAQEGDSQQLQRPKDLGSGLIGIDDALHPWYV